MQKTEQIATCSTVYFYENNTKMKSQSTLEPRENIKYL